jgi:hypothetical protein
MKKEFVVWGYPRSADASDPLAQCLLLTHLKSEKEARDKMQILQDVHGCHNMTIQALDGTPPNFAATVNV